MVELTDIDWTSKVFRHTTAYGLCRACGANIKQTYTLVHTLYGSVRVSVGCGCVRVASRSSGTGIGKASHALLLALELMT